MSGRRYIRLKAVVVPGVGVQKTPTGDDWQWTIIMRLATCAGCSVFDVTLFSESAMKTRKSLNDLRRISSLVRFSNLS